MENVCGISHVSCHVKGVLSSRRRHDNERFALFDGRHADAAEGSITLARLSLLTSLTVLRTIDLGDPPRNLRVTLLCVPWR